MRLFLVLAISLMIMIPQVTKAAVSAVRPFGGTVLATIPCTCQVSGSVIVLLMPIAPYYGMFLWQPPLTVPYAWYYPYYGVKVLGNYVTGGICSVYAGTTCVTIPVLGTITQVGSSLR